MYTMRERKSERASLFYLNPPFLSRLDTFGFSPTNPVPDNRVQSEDNYNDAKCLVKRLRQHLKSHQKNEWNRRGHDAARIV